MTHHADHPNPADIQAELEQLEDIEAEDKASISLYHAASEYTQLSSKLANHQSLEALFMRLRYVLEKLSKGKLTQLSPSQQEQILELLTTDSALRILLPEIQGGFPLEEQPESAEAVEQSPPVSSSESGHYVNSSLSSMGQLLIDEKINTDCLAAFRDFFQSQLGPDFESQRPSLFHSILQNIAFPDKISQHSKQSCAATRIEALMAMDHPAGYINTVKLLASEGQALLAGGALLQYAHIPGQHGGRSLASQLLQASLMEYAENNLCSASQERVSQDRAQGSTLYHYLNGLTLDETRRLLSGVMGDERIAHAYTVAEGECTPAELIQRTEHFIQSEYMPLLLDLYWGDNGRGGDGIHALLLTNLDADYAYLINPWGALNAMCRADFEERIHTVIALKNPPQLSKRTLNKEHYQILIPEDYYNTQQLEDLGFERALYKRAQNMRDAELREAVLAYMSELKTRQEFMNLAPLLSDYVYAERAGYLSDARQELCSLIATAQKKNPLVGGERE